VEKRFYKALLEIGARCEVRQVGVRVAAFLAFFFAG
jgi:hypothetical protein